MKAVYWAPVHGQPGTTSNVLVTSLVTGLHFRRKGIITQSHFNYNNLEAPFIDANPDNKHFRKYFSEVGIDALIRNFKCEKLSKEWLEYCCTDIPNSNMMLLPGTTQTIREAFDYEMDRALVQLFNAIDEYTGIVFVDSCSGSNALSMKLIENADIVIVNLSQNINFIDMFFNKYKTNFPEKIFYLFGNYDHKSKYNLANIRKKYGKYINSNNSGIIPYNTGFRDSQIDGKVVDFIRQNLNCKKKDPNYYFMQKAIRSTGKLLKLAGVTMEKE